MSQKLWRVVRACVELGGANPLVQIHDQGAGGNCNVVKEIIYPLGAEIDVRAVKVGSAQGRGWRQGGALGKGCGWRQGGALGKGWGLGGSMGGACGHDW